MSKPTKARPPVTIAIPTIGRMDYLPSLLASAEAQTFTDFEALILDNASPPEAQALFAEWEKKDRRFRVLRVDERVPMFTNFNRGWEHANGEILVYFHDDDLYAPRFVEAHHAFMRAHPNVGFSGTNVDFIDQHGTLTEARRWIGRDETWGGRKYIEFVMKRGRNIVPMQSIAYRKDALAPKGIDDTLSCWFGDYVLLMRIAEKYDVGLLADALVSVRRHEHQFSAHGGYIQGRPWKVSEAFAIRARVMREYLDELRGRFGSTDPFVKDIDRALKRMVRVGSIWGWISSPEPEDASTCLSALEGSRLDDEIKHVLRRIDGLGFDARMRSQYVAPLLRRVGNALKV